MGVGIIRIGRRLLVGRVEGGREGWDLSVERGVWTGLERVLRDEKEMSGMVGMAGLCHMSSEVYIGKFLPRRGQMR